MVDKLAFMFPFLEKLMEVCKALVAVPNQRNEQTIFFTIIYYVSNHLGECKVSHMQTGRMYSIALLYATYYSLCTVC